MERDPNAKRPRTEALWKMTSLIEERVTEEGWSEKEKNERVTRFVRRVKTRRSNLRHVTVNINADLN